jgi:hypothetical protein
MSEHMEKDAHPIKELFDELFTLLENLEAQNSALLQFLKDRGIVSEEKLTPFLQQAGNASSVKWRAARVRMEYLLTSSQKETKDKDRDKEKNKDQDKEGEKQPAEKQPTEKEPAEKQPAASTAAETSKPANLKTGNGAAKPQENIARKQESAPKEDKQKPASDQQGKPQKP